MTDVLNVLILSGHMTIEHDNAHRSFRQHNQWITTLLEDTGRFSVRVVEDPRGLPASVIDRYDVLIVIFEGRDGYHDMATGFGEETDAAILRFVHDEGKGIVWFHGSAAQEARLRRSLRISTRRGGKSVTTRATRTGDRADTGRRDADPSCSRGIPCPGVAPRTSARDERLPREREMPLRRLPGVVVEPLLPAPLAAERAREARAAK